MLHAGVHAFGKVVSGSRRVCQLEHIALRYGKVAAALCSSYHPPPACDVAPPAGQLPALEHGLDVVEATGDEQAAARAIIAYLRAHGADLDARLTAMQVCHVM